MVVYLCTCAYKNMAAVGNFCLPSTKSKEKTCPQPGSDHPNSENPEKKAKKKEKKKKESTATFIQL